MKLTDYTDNAETDSQDRPVDAFDSEALHEEEHEQNDNWEWSAEFTEFIHDEIEGRSLKVCPGLRPICDVNLDIKHLGDIADSDNAAFNVEPITSSSDRLQDLRGTVSDDAGEDIIYGRITGENGDTDGLYDGYACYGDMFELPFDDNSFDTVVGDPPWLNLTTEERRVLFEEIVRVTAPTGKILYNATWIPEDEHARQFQLRFRQQLDYWGGPSFAAFYRRSARDIPELFDAHDYESVERYPEESAFWSEALSIEHNTDPKKVSGDSDHHQYCCPMCGCAQLGHLRGEFFETSDGEYNTYQCHNCEFRVDSAEVNRLAEALETATAEQNVSVQELTDIEYTPSCVEQQLEQLGPNDSLDDAPFSADLPWVPRYEHAVASETPELDVPDGLSENELAGVFELIATIPSVQDRVGDDVTDLPDSELQHRVETLGRAVKETSVSHVRTTIHGTPTKTSSDDQGTTPARISARTNTVAPPAAD